ncbi:MBL fold metallo-hydrolase [soil metagenome]
MKSIAHGEHLSQLVLVGAMNAYFVREQDGLTLIDTTVSGAAKPILAKIDELGQPLRRIVITHAHADHCGSLDALHAQRPDTEVLVSARDALFLAGDRSAQPGEPKGRIFAPFYPRIKTRPTRTLQDGDMVGSLRAVAAPGHTPGQLAFLDTRDDTLICGDAYIALGGLFVTTQPVKRFPVPALVGTWHKPTAYETAERLRALNPRRLGTGHGKVIANPGPDMDRALREAPRG